MLMVDLTDFTSPNKLAIYLTGDVNSMVLLHNLKEQDQEFVALYLAYADQEDWEDRLAKVTEWCNNYEIEMTVKIVDEIVGLTKRNEYHDMAKRIKYEVFQQAIDNGAEGILVGYNADDHAENIFMDLIKLGSTQNILDIPVTPLKTVVHDVPIWSPFIRTSHADIMAYAGEHHVPYLNICVAQPWANHRNRIMLRNEIFPTLKENYKTNLREQMQHLAQSSTDWREIVQFQVMNPILESVQQSPLGLWLDCSNYTYLNGTFWKEMFYQIGLKYNVPAPPSRRVLQDFPKIFEKPVAQQLYHNDGVVWWLEKNVLMFYRENVIPRDFARQIVEPGEELDIGNWKIRVSQVKNGEWEWKQVKDEDVLANKIQYYLPIQDDNQLMLTSKFNRVFSNVLPHFKKNLPKVGLEFNDDGAGVTEYVTVEMEQV